MMCAPLLSLLAATAIAGEPVLVAHGLVWAGNQAGAPDPGGGLGGTLGWRTEAGIDGELLAEAVGTRGADTETHVLAGAALRLVDDGRDAPTLWWSVGLGAAVQTTLRPVLSTGARLELPFAEPYLLRVEARLLIDPSTGVQGAALTAGPVLLARAPKPTPAPVAQTAPTERWPDAMVWLDHPHCGWHEASETPALMERHGALMPVELRADGHQRLQTTLGQVSGARLTPGPAQGALIVVAHPGDLLELGGDTIEADAEGVAVMRAAVGPVEIISTGGGQQVRLYAAVSRHHATWVRVPSPGPTTVSFAVDSAGLTPQDRLALLRLGTQAGGWSFTVQGFASPEGDLAGNLDLAARRAETVARVLRETGLAPDRILALPAAIGDPERLPNWGRIVQVQPLPSGAQP